MAYKSRILVVLAFVLALAAGSAFAQSTAATKAAKGSQTAKDGFKNEDEIRDKFNNWKTDADAREWLKAMGIDAKSVESVVAAKPHGEKADVEITVKSIDGATIKQGISIKLVSSANGFNQIDKTWVSTYAKKWKMPQTVHDALKLFVGETPPVGTQAASLPVGEEKQPSRLRSTTRMYLNELDEATQKAVLDFFTEKKDEIVSDLFAGDGEHAAGWMMVAYKASADTRWVIRSSADTIKFFADGPVEFTRAGNLKIGRITMQRKGGDGGRETAKMLQFKINPVQLFEAK